MICEVLTLAAVVVGTWNGNWFPSGRAEHRAHPDVEAATITAAAKMLAGGLRAVDPATTANVYAVHLKSNYGATTKEIAALDYVFCRGLKSVDLPRIVPNDELSDHYALFVLLKP